MKCRYKTAAFLFKKKDYSQITNIARGKAGHIA